MDQFVGQVIAVGFNWAPDGWALCNGQLLPISQYDVLFSLLGTTFGGDGQTTFGVPDLRGRSPLGQGQAPGQPDYPLGQPGGTESVSLNASQIAAHSHPLMASTAEATTATPAGNLVLAQPAATTPFSVYGAATSTTPLAAGTIGQTTGGQGHENRQPFNTVNYIIATVGIYPSQS